MARGIAKLVTECESPPINVDLQHEPHRLGRSFLPLTRSASPPMKHAALEFLDQRRSTPSRLLAEPGPRHDQLLRMLETAVRVPDHGRLAPWRFLRIAGDARTRLGERLLDIFRRERPDAPDAALDKERSRFAHAPVVIAVVGRIASDHKIPEIEQRLSAGAACLQLLHAAHALGFGAQWLTGWAAYHPDVHATLGLAQNEEIIGFVHIGTPISESPDHERPDAAALLSDWTG